MANAFRRFPFFYGREPEGIAPTFARAQDVRQFVKNLPGHNAHLIAAEFFEAPAAGGAVAGTMSATLDAATLAGTGAVAIGGSLATTLGVLVLSGTGTVAVGGSASPSLGALSVVGTGAVPVAGILTPSLSAVTLSGTGDSGAPAAVISAPAGVTSWSRPVRSRTFRGRR